MGLAPAQHQGPFDGAFAAFPHSGLVAKLLKPCVFFVEEVDEGGSFGEKGGPCFLAGQQADAFCAGFGGVWIGGAFCDHLVEGKGLFLRFCCSAGAGLLERGRSASPPDTRQSSQSNADRRKIPGHRPCSDLRVDRL